MTLSVVRDIAVDTELATFDDFWTLFPKRIARKEAEKAWNRLTASDRIEALTALVAWRREWLKRGELQYVPNGATWLNGERWTDEIPVVSTAAHASHVVATPPCSPSGARGQIPQSVKDVLAKLRAK